MTGVIELDLMDDWISIFCVMDLYILCVVSTDLKIICKLQLLFNAQWLFNVQCTAFTNVQDPCRTFLYTYLCHHFCDATKLQIISLC